MAEHQLAGASGLLVVLGEDISEDLRCSHISFQYVLVY